MAVPVRIIFPPFYAWRKDCADILQWLVSVEDFDGHHLVSAGKRHQSGKPYRHVGGLSEIEINVVADERVGIALVCDEVVMVSGVQVEYAHLVVPEQRRVQLYDPVSVSIIVCHGTK